MQVYLNQRQYKILEILSHQEECITSLEISKKLSISSKTVQNEIATINQLYGKNIISAKKGRGYNLKAGFSLNGENQQMLSENRKIFIIKELVTHNSIDYYELADKLYISPSSLNKDMKDVNAEINQRFHVSIVRKQNRLYFKGNNANKQKVVVYYLLEESENANFDTSVLESYFETLDVRSIRNTIFSYVREKHINLNDFQLVSILLHILVAQLNQTFQEPVVHSDFSEYLFTKTGLHLNEEVAKRIDISFRLGNDSIEQDCMDYKEFLLHVFDDIKHIYSINFKEDTVLLDELSLHLKYAEQRCKTNTQLKNPLIEEFKKKHVLVYDIAVYIASKFYDKTKLHLDMDEISYLAIHILGSLQKLKGGNLKVVLINPYGKAVERLIVNKLDTIPNVLYCGNYSFLDEKGALAVHPDLIITLVQLDWKHTCEIYKVDDYLNSQEYTMIERCIKQIHVKKAMQSLTISSCFHESLFLTHVSAKSKKEVIDLMCQRLLDNGFVDAQFAQQVYQREEVAPTCFSDQLAIPHSIKKCAKKSGISVAILENPIPWNGYAVRVVFLFALDKTFDQVPKLYELILDAIDDPKRYEAILACDDFSSFMSILMKERER